MKLRHRILICYCTRPALKFALFLLLLALSLTLLCYYSYYWLLLLLIVPMADLIGARFVCQFHPAFEDDLNLAMEDASAESTEMRTGQTKFTTTSTSGSINHWLLKKLPDSMEHTMMIPHRDYVTIARRKGTIFPPNNLSKMTFSHSSEEITEVYYQDIGFVEIENNIIKLHTAGGEVVEYADPSGKAGEALLYLRQRLREHKSGNWH